MKVRDLMTKHVQSCEPNTNLAAATELMWKADCGVLPVVADGKLTGILTDRDICMALGTRNRPASEISAGEVATADVETCEPGADVHAAMTLMRKARVRRLPVVEDGQLEGILALNDIVDAVDRKHGALDYEQVMSTMKAICEHRSHRSTAAVA
jgi:CBS domain-containing protein